MKIEDQPPPVHNDSPAIVDLVIEDLKERKRVGIERYGVALQADNGRDALVDHYQEMMDATLYARQEIEDRALLIEKIASYIEFRASRLSDENWNMSEFATTIANEIRSGAYRDTVPAPPPGHMEDADDKYNDPEHA